MTKCVKDLEVGERVLRKGVVFVVGNVSRDRRGLYKISLKSEDGERECLNCLPEGITLEVFE